MVSLVGYSLASGYRWCRMHVCLLFGHLGLSEALAGVFMNYTAYIIAIKDCQF